MGEEVEVGEEAAASCGCQYSVTVNSEQGGLKRCVAAFTQAWEAQTRKHPKKPEVRSWRVGRVGWLEGRTKLENHRP